MSNTEAKKIPPSKDLVKAIRDLEELDQQLKDIIARWKAGQNGDVSMSEIVRILQA